MNKLLTLALITALVGSAGLMAAEKREAPVNKDHPRLSDSSVAPAPVKEKMDESSKSNEMDSKESKENDMSAESAERRK